MEEKTMAILFVAHEIDDTIIKRYTDIKSSVKDISDVFFLFNKEEG